VLHIIGLEKCDEAVDETHGFLDDVKVNEWDGLMQVRRLNADVSDQRNEGDASKS